MDRHTRAYPMTLGLEGAPAQRGTKPDTEPAVAWILRKYRANYASRKGLGTVAGDASHQSTRTA